MAHALEAPRLPLVRDFRALAARGQAFALATVVETQGSTYRKAGAQMLLAQSGETFGLLSGGCLESDLALHAREVVETGCPRRITYDMRGDDDRLFGIGSACEGAISVLLQRVGPAEDWQPLAAMAERVESRAGGALALVVEGPAAGRAWWPGGGDAPWPEPAAVRAARESATGAGPRTLAFAAGSATSAALVILLPPAPLLLLCGAGPDARPLAQHAVALGFAVTVCDHRPGLLDPARFPHCRLSCQPPEAFRALPDVAECAAAVVMSHHFDADLAYLGALADCGTIGYVGLLGPAPRRDRLLAALGGNGARFEGRLHAPVGLDIGARTPEAIALAVAAELHAWCAGRGGGPFSRHS